MGDFTNFFLANVSEAEAKELPTDVRSREAAAFANRLWQPVLELTHNHGTEKDDKFAVHTGNADPQGFGHIGFLVDDLEAMCQEMEDAGVPFFKKPNDGKMRGIAFALDPSGYRVELVQRGMKIPAEMLAPKA